MLRNTSDLVECSYVGFGLTCDLGQGGSVFLLVFWDCAYANQGLKPMVESHKYWYKRSVFAELVPSPYIAVRQYESEVGSQE